MSGTNMQDVNGYEVDSDGRYATPEVAAQAYTDDLYGFISDMSKEVLGFRFRMDTSYMTFAELEKHCDYWSTKQAA